jgi:hypothetical protein
VLPMTVRVDPVRIGATRALVTTPVAATLLFRGPLLRYGNVVIIEPADVLFVLASGLADVFGEPTTKFCCLLGLVDLGTPANVDGILTENLDIAAGQRPANALS